MMDWVINNPLTLLVGLSAIVIIAVLIITHFIRNKEWKK